MLMIVMKFGGTSVEDAAAIDRSCAIVGERIARKPLVVVSALGGATNGLLEAGGLAARGEVAKATEIINKLEGRHTELLPVDGGRIYPSSRAAESARRHRRVFASDSGSDCLLRRSPVITHIHRPAETSRFRRHPHRRTQMPGDRRSFR